jgi:hypothetical protein
MLVLNTCSYKHPGDGTRWIWRILVSLIRRFQPDAYREINATGRLVSALPVDKLGWTLFRCVVQKANGLWIRNSPFLQSPNFNKRCCRTNKCKHHRQRTRRPLALKKKSCCVAFERVERREMEW